MSSELIDLLWWPRHLFPSPEFPKLWFTLICESPSSSASDVDNLNNVATADKAAIAKGVSFPQVAGNHVIAARNRPNFVRLLNFAQDVNFAMEASRKSQIAFAAANGSLEEVKYREGISSIKRALDFNFQDIELRDYYVWYGLQWKLSTVKSLVLMEIISSLKEIMFPGVLRL